VIGAYTVTGEADALVHLRVSDTAHLERTLEALSDEPFVARTRSVIVLSRLLERQVPGPRTTERFVLSSVRASQRGSADDRRPSPRGGC
jgi:hypothetical protein